MFVGGASQFYINVLKPDFRQIQQIRCVYDSLRCLDLNDDDTTDYFTTYTYAG